MIFFQVHNTISTCVLHLLSLVIHPPKHLLQVDHRVYLDF